MFVKRISVFSFLVFFILYFCVKVKQVTCQNWNPAVSIQYNTRHFCTGSIVTKNVILTSAHCFTDEHNYQNSLKYVSVLPGTNCLTNEHNVKRHFAKDVMIHPEFSFHERRADIALLILIDSVPTKLLHDNPSTLNNLATEPPKPGDSCTVTGWSRMFPHGPYDIHARIFYMFIRPESDCCRYRHYWKRLSCLSSHNGFHDRRSPDDSRDRRSPDDGHPLIFGYGGFGYGGFGYGGFGYGGYGYGGYGYGGYGYGGYDYGYGGYDYGYGGYDYGGYNYGGPGWGILDWSWGWGFGTRRYRPDYPRGYGYRRTVFNDYTRPDYGDRGSVVVCNGKQAGVGLFNHDPMYGSDFFVTDVSSYRDWIVQICYDALK